ARATKYQASRTKPFPKAVGGALASGAVLAETGAVSAAMVRHNTAVVPMRPAPLGCAQRRALSMNRRTLMVAGAAAALTASGADCAHAVTDAAQAPFESDRIQVSVEGRGPDVMLIPGLSS